MFTLILLFFCWAQIILISCNNKSPLQQFQLRILTWWTRHEIYAVTLRNALALLWHVNNGIVNWSCYKKQVLVSDKQGHVNAVKRLDSFGCFFFFSCQLVLESMTFSSAFNFNKVYCGGARFYNTLQNVGAGVHLTSTHGSHDFQQSA